MLAEVPDALHEMPSTLRRFVRRRVADEHTADDITQDVMLKLQAHLQTAREIETLPAWVFAVARNAIVDHYRSRAIREHVDLATIDPATEEDADTQRAEAVRELTPCLLRMVERLAEPYRTAVRLVDFEQLSQQALADRVGVSLSGAKSRVQRGRQMLREMILDCCQVERDGRGNVIDYQPTERSARYCGDAAGKPQCGT